MIDANIMNIFKRGIIYYIVFTIFTIYVYIYIFLFHIIIIIIIISFIFFYI